MMKKIIDSINNKRNGLDKDDKNIIINIIESFGIKGLSLILSFFTMPIYIRFFENQTVLGVWYTLLSVMNWVTFFDLGLGNGLRNKLPFLLINNDVKKTREYISSTYFSVLMISGLWAIVGNILISLLNWNSILNISSKTISDSAIILSLRIVLLGILVQFIFKLITSILYAMQKPAVTNFLTLLTTVLTLAIVSISPSENASKNLVTMSIINAIAINVPYLFATIVVFAKYLKGCFPNIKFFNIKCAKEVTREGLVLLWLSIVWMVISNTNELLISMLSGPADVVTFQAYNKIFSTVGSLFTLALSPMWSAVTKAYAEFKYKWISKTNNFLLKLSLVVFIVELAIVPFLQFAINIWLGKDYIIVNYLIAVIFVISSTLSYVHNVNTSFGNGISYYKVQVIWMTVAAAVDIPLAYFFVNMLRSWVGVTLANIVAIIPYEIIEIWKFNKLINKNFLNNSVKEEMK